MSRPRMWGYYRHFKGGKYQVRGFATHSETLEELVLYSRGIGLQDWARPLSLWNEDVEWPDGVRRPRFVPEKEAPK